MAGIMKTMAAPSKRMLVTAAPERVIASLSAAIAVGVASVKRAREREMPPPPPSKPSDCPP